MLERARNYIPWITGILAIGGLVAMSLLDVPDTKLVTTPAPVARQATGSTADAPDAEVSEGSTEARRVCADGKTKSYSDRPCAPDEQLEVIPITISPTR